MIGTALTAIIGLVAKGKAAKAIASGVGGIVTIPVVAPLVHEFLEGVLAGAGPELRQAGALVGAALASAAVNYAVTWFAPANAPAGKG
jgi:hypothetical protein